MNKLKGLESELIKDFQDNSEKESDDGSVDDYSDSDEEVKIIKDHNDKIFE